MLIKMVGVIVERQIKNIKRNARRNGKQKGKQKQKKREGLLDPLPGRVGTVEPGNLALTLGTPMDTILGPLMVLPEWQIAQRAQRQEHQSKRDQVRH